MSEELRGLQRFSDEQLVPFARGGEQAAFDELVRRYRSEIRLYARPYYLPGGTRADLEQEGLIGLYKAVRDFDPTAGVIFRSFVKVCVSRQLVTAVQMATRVKHQSLNESTRVAQNDEGEQVQATDLLTAGDRWEPDAILQGRDQLAEFARSFRERLTVTECAALLAWLHGFDYEEIAAKLQADAKTVDNALQRAHEKLRRDSAPKFMGGRAERQVHDCPSCDGITVKKAGRGRPPRCVVCRARELVAA